VLKLKSFLFSSDSFLFSSEQEALQDKTCYLAEHRETGYHLWLWLAGTEHWNKTEMWPHSYCRAHSSELCNYITTTTTTTTTFSLLFIQPSLLQLLQVGQATQRRILWFWKHAFLHAIFCQVSCRLTSSVKTLAVQMFHLIIDCIYACECIYRNQSIADYLSANGYTNTLAEFQKETNMVCWWCFSVLGICCYMYNSVVVII